VDEPYLHVKMNYQFGPVQVPENKFFFLGDNRNSSYGAHLWPSRFMDRSELIGKVVFRFYPFNEMQVI
jgi:signal peptidase I